MSGPAPVKHELWLRGIARAAKADRLAGALVAEHALTVYGYRRGDPAWASFFSTIEGMRDALLERAGVGSGDRSMFDAYYRCVRLGDSFSLHFCNGWTTPQHTLGYTTSLSGPVLRITPDPFGGARVALRVLAHRIPARRYADAADLRRTLASVTPEVMTGEALGEHAVTAM